MANPDVVPCPTCWGLADLLPPEPDHLLHRSQCPAGHVNTLAPTVLAYLLTKLGPAFG